MSIIIGTGTSVLTTLDLELQDLVDPVPKVRYPGVDARLVLLRAADAPADDASQHEATVAFLDDHWASAVTLE